MIFWIGFLLFVQGHIPAELSASQIKQGAYCEQALANVPGFVRKTSVFQRIVHWYESLILPHRSPLEQFSWMLDGETAARIIQAQKKFLIITKPINKQSWRVRLGNRVYRLDPKEGTLASRSGNQIKDAPLHTIRDEHQIVFYLNNEEVARVWADDPYRDIPKTEKLVWRVRNIFWFLKLRDISLEWNGQLGRRYQSKYLIRLGWSNVRESHFVSSAFLDGVFFEGDVVFDLTQMGLLTQVYSIWLNIKSPINSIDIMDIHNAWVIGPLMEALFQFAETHAFDFETQLHLLRSEAVIDVPTFFRNLYGLAEENALADELLMKVQQLFDALSDPAKSAGFSAWKLDLNGLLHESYPMIHVTARRPILAAT